MCQGLATTLRGQCAILRCNVRLKCSNLGQENSHFIQRLQSRISCNVDGRCDGYCVPGGLGPLRHLCHSQDHCGSARTIFSGGQHEITHCVLTRTSGQIVHHLQSNHLRRLQHSGNLRPSSTFVSCAAAALANCNSFSILLPWLVSRSLVRHVQLPRAFDRARRTAQNDQIHFVQKVPEPKVIQPVIEKSPNFLLVATLCHILHTRNQSRVTLN